MSKKISQGEIYMCDLSMNSMNNEQSGIHPVLIVSSDIRNENSGNVFVFPITHAKKKFQPTHYKLYKIDYPFFTYDINTVTSEEGRSISKKRIRKYIGSINNDDLLKILNCKDFIFFEKNPKIKNIPIDILQKYVYTIDYGDKFRDEKYGLVIQCNKGNYYGDTTIVVPIVNINESEKIDNNIHYQLNKDDFEILNTDFNLLKVKVPDVASVEKFKVINCIGKLNNDVYNKVLEKLRVMISELEFIN